MRDPQEKFIDDKRAEIQAYREHAEFYRGMETYSQAAAYERLAKKSEVELDAYLERQKQGNA